MYQTVGHQALNFYSQAMRLPLYRREISGKPLNQDMEYNGETTGDEVEDLHEALRSIQQQVKFDAISVGAIMSNYQRSRAENVCRRLNIQMLCYLWERDQHELLRDMIDGGIHAIIIKVAAMGLDPQRHLGKTLQEIYPELLRLNKEYGINLCGEGGEYETLTLDCPLFKEKLVIKESEIVIHSNDAFAPVGFLKPTSIELVAKS